MKQNKKDQTPDCNGIHQKTMQSLILNCKSFQKKQTLETTSKYSLPSDSVKMRFLNSPHFNQYQQSMKANTSILNLSKLNTKFLQERISYHQGKKSQLKIDFNYAAKSKTLRIMEFACKISCFTFLIKVLNLKSEDQLKFQLINPINQGAFGSVYKMNIKDKDCAIKSIALVKPIQEIIKNTMKQIMIMKICSLLQIAPPFYELSGFDMITTDENILFGCQKGICIEEFIENNCHSEDQIDLKFQKLKQKLALMHKLSITHNDIKLDNIVYSPSLKQFVFIDFGLSSMNIQQIGLMKMESAKGSLNYCCQEMKQLLITGCKSGYVDVYFNDLIGLQKTIESTKLIFCNIVSFSFYPKILQQNNFLFQKFLSD